MNERGPPCKGGPDKATTTITFQQQPSSHISGPTSTSSGENASGERERYTARRLDSVIAGVLTPKDVPTSERRHNKARWLESLIADLKTPEARQMAKQRGVSIKGVIQIARVIASLDSFTQRGWIWARQSWLARVIDGGCSERRVIRAIHVLRDRGHLRVTRAQNGNVMSPLYYRFSSTAESSQVTLAPLKTGLPSDKESVPKCQRVSSEVTKSQVGTFRTLEKPLTQQADSGCDISLNPNLTLMEREGSVDEEGDTGASASGEVAGSTEEEPISEAKIERKVSGIIDSGLREALLRLWRANRRASH
jgi:hypothetical protein